MAFSWGSTNNNNNNNNNNNSSNGFSWGSNNNGNNNQNNNQNNNNNNNNAGNNSWGWGNQQQGEQSNNNNNNNSNSGWGNNNNNNSSFNVNTNSNNNGNSWGNNNNTNNNTNNNGAINPNNDHVVPDTASDAISCVKFHPQNAQFIVSSWDNSISVYEFFGNNQSKKLGQQKHDKPILNCCYDHSGNNIFSAGCDNMIKIWNPQQNAFTNLGQHQAPVRCIEWCANTNFLISGSWDRTLSFWDPRSAGNNGQIKPVHSVNLQNKVYAMAQKGNRLVVALSNNDIKTYDLRNQASEVFSTLSEHQKNSKAVCLKRQIRTIDIFPNNEGYVAASIGGRVIIKHFNRNQAAKDFSYKCHRHSQPNNKSVTHVFAVNAIKFHQQTSVFATGGDDGEIVTWDKDGRAKLFTFKQMSVPNYRNQSGNSSSNVTYNRMPITWMDFHNNGQYLLYSTSYNWNRGQEFHDKQQQTPTVYLHQVQKNEVDKSKK